MQTRNDEFQVMRSVIVEKQRRLKEIEERITNAEMEASKESELRAGSANKIPRPPGITAQTSETPPVLPRRPKPPPPILRCPLDPAVVQVPAAEDSINPSVMDRNVQGGATGMVGVQEMFEMAP